jgi:hypothetical protein
MPNYTLLALVDQVSGELGLTQPSSVIGSQVNQTVQFLALAQRLGKDLSRDFQWQRLVKSYIFQTTAALTKTGTTASGSPVITGMNNTTSIVAAMVVSGVGIAAYSQVVSNDSSTQVTMDTPATASGSVTLTFAYQDYSLPSDFDRMVSDTQWDRTSHWRNIGTKTSQEWQTLQGGVISVGPRERYRIYDGKLRLFPALTTVYNESFEYVSVNWVVATGGTSATKALYSADTDFAVFPDNLMCSGLKYYFLKAKKLDYGIEEQEFMNIRSSCKASDVPVAAVSLAPVMYDPLVGPWSIQDGNWPTTSS